MTTDPRARPLLDHLETIAPIPSGERVRLMPRLAYRDVQAGGYLVRAGDRCDTISFVTSGLLRYFYLNAEGREFTRYFCRTGHFVSPTEGPDGALYSIQAVTDTRLVTIPRAAWASLLAADPYWGRVTMAVQEYAMRLAEVRERSLVLESATERYLRLLDDFPGIEAHVRQYDIASYLGITPVALSRIRSRLARA